MSVPDIKTMAHGSKLVEHDLNRLRTTSGKIVGSVFYGTMLKMMRESKIKGAYGHGGRGEEVFAGQLDQLLAERMGASGSGGPQDALFRSLAHQQSLISRRSEAGMSRGVSRVAMTESMTDPPAKRTQQR